MAAFGKEESSHCSPLSPLRVANINFLLKYQCIIYQREKGVRINKNDHQMNNDLIFYQILSTNFLRKCIEISLENFYVDIGN